MNIVYTSFKILYNKYNKYSWKEGVKMKEGMNMTELEKEIAIDTYINLMRIKEVQTVENTELDYQIKIAKIKLLNFGIDISELSK